MENKKMKNGIIDLISKDYVIADILEILDMVAFEDGQKRRKPKDRGITEKELIDKVVVKFIPIYSEFVKKQIDILKTKKEILVVKKGVVKVEDVLEYEKPKK